TGYNSYKNLQVHSGSISIDATPVSDATIHTFSTTITVEPDSRFSTALIEANEINSTATGVTALHWQAFPPAGNAYQTLSTDPDGRIFNGLTLKLVIN